MTARIIGALVRARRFFFACVGIVPQGALVLCALLAGGSAQAGCQSGRCNTPSAGITLPANGSTFRNNQTITLSGRATGDFITNAIGDLVIYGISRVDVYNGTTLVGVATLGATGYNVNDVPYNDYSYTFAAMPVGTYSLGVIPRDSGNSAGTRVNVSVTVTTNLSPTVSVTGLTAGAVITYPGPVPLTATAADADGTVTGLQFFVNGAAVSGVFSSAPYSFNWTPPGVSTSYLVTAKATDNSGATTTSAAVTISVAFNAPPVSSGNGIPGKLAGALGVSSAGAAQYTIPIAMPPGTVGMVPNLAMTYDSSAGNGIAGVGWGIKGLSQISRCGRDWVHEGLRAGVDLTTNDRFCLDGQRLIATNGTYGAAGTEYRTEIDSFTKVVSVGAPSSGASYFTATLPDGTRVDYGNSSDSKLQLAGQSTPLAWSMNKVTDARTNFYSVTYLSLGTTGQQLLSRIDYTGNAAGSIAAYNSVRFLYDQTRTDAETRYVLGAKISSTARLVNVQTYAGATLVKDYRFAYNTSAPTLRSRIQSVTECADTGTACLPATTFNWENTPPNFSGTLVTYPPTLTEFAAVYNGGDYNGKDYWVDLNGDGRPDHCIVVQHLNSITDTYTWEELLCSLTQSGNAPPVAIKLQSFDAGSEYSFVDFDGDGITDVCNVTCYRMASASVAQLIGVPGAYSKGQQSFHLNLNGDGRIDYCQTTNDNVSGNPWRLDCWLGNGAGYGPVIHMGALNVPTCGSATCQQLQFAWADVSGDGIPSFCRIESGAMRCQKWTPTGFAPEIATAIGIDLGENTGGRAWVDINGDGKADLCRVISDTPGQPNGTGHIACTLSTGTGFGDTIVSGTINIGYAATRSWVDVNGDGKADFCRGIGIPTGGVALATSTTECIVSTSTGFTGSIVVATGTATTQTTLVDGNGDAKPDACSGPVGSGSGSQCKTSTGVFADLLLNVTDGLGATSSLTYRPISDASVYTKRSGAVFPSADLQDTTWVVQRASASNGVGGTADTSYAYEGARVHLQGRGFLGFAATNSTGPNGTLSRSETRQDFPYIGLGWHTTASNGGVTLSDTVVTYAASASAPFQVYPTLTVTKTYDLNGAFINWSESATALASFDIYGNPLQIDTLGKDASGTADGYSQTSVATYQNDTINWILGRPTSLAITSRVPGKANSTRTTASSYFTANPGLGLLKQNVVEPNNGSLPVTNLKLVSDYTYDNFGNPLTKTVSGANITTRTETTNTYDAQGRGPVSVKNALNHLETRVYDWRHGVTTSLQGPNLLSTNWSYDAFARPLTEDRADGTRTTTSYSWCSACVPGSVYSVGKSSTVIATGTAVTPPSRAYYDTLGRSIVSAQTGFAGLEVYRDTVYDSLGRVSSASMSHLAGDTQIRWTQYTLDALGRTVQSTTPDNAITSASYNGRTTSATNNNGVTSSRTVNSQGKVVSSTDAQATASASTVSYEYDNWGNLSKTTDALGNMTTMVYDLRGRRTQLVDPDMGIWNYVTDNLGQITTQTDAKNQSTTYTYDVLGRLTRRLEADLDSRWYYETNAAGTACNKGLGKLCEATAANGYNRRYVYDNLGRLSSQTSHVDADYTASWTYDGAGRLGTRTFPASVAAFATPLAVNYNYNTYGILQSVSNAATSATYWTRNAENTDGSVTSETYGNGLIGTRSYDPLMGRLTSLQAGTSGAPTAVQNQSYHYDSLGRLDQRQDSVVGTSETFAYDGLNRLTTANLTTPSLGTQTTNVGFNAVGNIISKTGVGTYTYPAAGAGRPHAVSSVSGTVNGVANPSYSYDLNGNMQTNGAKSFTWTSFNMPATLTKAVLAGSPGAGVGTFLYGPEHQRLKQTWVDSAKTLSTVYLNEPHFEKEVNSQTGLTEFKHYVKVGGDIVAIQTRRSNATEDVKYLIPDHLGSTSVVTDAAGAVIDRQAFDPWGDRRVASGANVGAADPTNLIQPTSTTRGYTGHEELDQANMGLVHMNARLYDPTLARFISADPNIQAPFNPQSFNRYSYVWNAPLNATDPSGYLTAILEAMQPSALGGWISGGGLGFQGFEEVPKADLEKVTVTSKRCQLSGSLCPDDPAVLDAWRKIRVPLLDFVVRQIPRPRISWAPTPVGAWRKSLRDTGSATGLILGTVLSLEIDIGTVGLAIPVNVLLTAGAIELLGGAGDKLGYVIDGVSITWSVSEGVDTPSDGNRVKDVPNRGEPGEVKEGERRTREYGEDGKPARDYDKPHQGDETDHVHEWPAGAREHPGRPYSPWPRK
jgi:RHS repeat-associated protein